MVDALIPVASGISGYRHGDRARPVEREMFAEMEGAWEARDIGRLVDLEVDGPGQPPDRVDGRIRERVRQMESESIAANSTEGKPQPLAPPAIDRLKEIRAPTLVFPGTAHMLTMERPADYNPAALDFLTASTG